MSKGSKFTQQSYKVAEAFPFEWIKKKWREGFHVTAMATSGCALNPELLSRYQRRQCAKP